jgi:hypothetical protein
MATNGAVTRSVDKCRYHIRWLIANKKVTEARGKEAVTVSNLSNFQMTSNEGKKIRISFLIVL